MLPALLLCLCFAAKAARAAPPEPVRYALSFEQRAQHLVTVTLHLAAPAGGHTDLFMPVWTPGSYLVRDFARHVQSLTATDAAGQTLRVSRPALHRWRVHHPKRSRALTVRYQVYARELSVRTNFVDADFGVLNGAATFLLPVRGDGPIEVTATLPAPWTTLATSLPAAPDPGAGATRTVRAPDRDTLIDSPLLLGPLTETPFAVAGVPHRLVDLPPHPTWRPARAVADAARVAEAARAVFGGFPTDLDRYVVLNVLAGSGGGLEHAHSTVLMGAATAMADTDDYRDWLRLVAHEYFHLWNVKRLRPVELGPFDYENPVLTDSLWIAEGITAYYDGLLVRRAGLTSDAAFLKQLTDKIDRLDATPGARVRSLALASRDAWIRAYKPDENSINSDVSYYLKGALVAWLLDAEVRNATGHAQNLDAVLRLAWRRYAGAKGYTPAQFEAVASEVAGRDLGPFFDAAVRGTGPLDFTPALKAFGLRFKPDAPKPDAAPPAAPALATGSVTGDGAWLGAEIRSLGGRTRVQAVPAHTPAFAAGLNHGDEWLAIDDDRLPADGPDDLLARLAPGAQVRLLVARRGRLRWLDATLGAPPKTHGRLEVDPAADAATAAARAAWLAGPTPEHPAPTPEHPAPAPEHPAPAPGTTATVTGGRPRSPPASRAAAPGPVVARALDPTLRSALRTARSILRTPPFIHRFFGKATAYDRSPPKCQKCFSGPGKPDMQRQQ